MPAHAESSYALAEQHGLPKSVHANYKGLRYWHPRIVWAGKHSSGAWMLIGWNDNPNRERNEGFVRWHRRLAFADRYSYRVIDCRSSKIETLEALFWHASHDWENGPDPRTPAPKDGRRVSGRPRDRQRSKAYKWEDANVKPWDGEKMDLAGLRSMVRMMFAMHHPTWPKMPDVKQTKRYGANCSWQGRQVNFSRAASTKRLVCHEVAHSMVAQTMHGNDEGHGPEWVGTYIHLLSLYCGFDEATLRASALDFGLRVGRSRLRAEDEPIPVIPKEPKPAKETKKMTVLAVSLDESLHARVKAAAKAKGQSLKEFVTTLVTDAAKDIVVEEKLPDSADAALSESNDEEEFLK